MFLFVSICLVFSKLAEVDGDYSKMASELEFAIKTKWDGSCIDHDPIIVRVSAANRNAIKINIEAPYFNDPAAPSTPPGPTNMLWDYEVVEAFFLNSEDETYLELEFGPHGHYLVLFLQGVRHDIKKLLPLRYRSRISEQSQRWTGEAIVPLCYFPAGVDKFNAFAIHGADPNRVYEALYPQQQPVTQPDFHRLMDYQPIDMTKILGEDSLTEYSDIWKDAMESN